MTDENLPLPSLEDSLAMMVDRVERAAFERWGFEYFTLPVSPSMDRLMWAAWKASAELDRQPPPSCA